MSDIEINPEEDNAVVVKTEREVYEEMTLSFMADAVQPDEELGDH